MEKKPQKIVAIRGMEDILPPASRAWRNIEERAAHLFSLYGYEEIRTPIVEPTALFERGVGETSSIVEKEMYSFVDKSDNHLTLRPEGTAPVVRAFIESAAYAQSAITRYWYFGPMFRYERPQKGRQRQFYQLGCELFGTTSPYADAEVMAMTAQFFAELGLSGITLQVNSIGCPHCRPTYNERLLQFLQQHLASLCEDCNRRMAKNPLRVLDCKNAACHEILKDAPTIGTFWCGECRTHFEAVQTGLRSFSVAFEVNERIVRGLDYYVRTAFEFTSHNLGSQNAVAAGGRYDGLVRDLAGPDVPGVGIAMGVERLLLLLEHAGKTSVDQQPLVFVAALSTAAIEAVLPHMSKLRQGGVRVEWDYEAKSLKSQMRHADKLGAQSVVIIGDDELAKGLAIVRNMQTKTQEEIPFDQIERYFVPVRV
ncbi:MAG: histidine--tRNA ligase [Deltaproteobacteria bacterium]|nr:histidine--tRNA ligase [Deltaproteobacteria bacterium]